MLSWLFSDPLPAGSEAPDFTLLDEHGNAVSLSALRGRNVVLIWYPSDDTPVCRRQLCEFRDQQTEWTDRNIAVFGVNPQSAESHARFQAKFQFPFPLLVDRGQRVGRLYHTHGLVPKRTVYLIGPDGIIRYARRGKPDPAEVLAAAAVL